MHDQQKIHTHTQKQTNTRSNVVWNSKRARTKESLRRKQANRKRMALCYIWLNFMLPALFNLWFHISQWANRCVRTHDIVMKLEPRTVGQMNKTMITQSCLHSIELNRSKSNIVDCVGVSLYQKEKLFHFWSKIPRDKLVQFVIMIVTHVWFIIDISNNLWCCVFVWRKQIWPTFAVIPELSNILWSRAQM